MHTMKAIRETLRTWFSFRSERQHRGRRARQNAILMITGGTITMPRKKSRF